MESRQLPNYYTALFLFLVLPQIQASPQHLRNNYPSQTVTAYLAKRSGEDGDGNIHLGTGPIVAIVLGTIAIVIASIFCCCPCWKMGPNGSWTEKKQRRARAKAGDLHPYEQPSGSPPVPEMHDNSVPSKHELHSFDSPPSYDDVEREQVVNGRNPDQRGGVGGVQELGGTAVKTLPRAHLN